MKIGIEDQSNILLILELKRLIDAVNSSSADAFDVFENDIFILYDPEDDELEEIDDLIGEYDLDIDPEEIDLIGEFIEASEAEPADECDDTDVNIDDFIRCVDADSVVQGIISPFDLFDFEDELYLTPDMFDSQPNFHHKQSDLKLWWRFGDDNVYSNIYVTFKKFSVIVNQCIYSLGRKTRKYAITHHSLEDWENAVM